jgi:hypothetical protein
MTRGYTYRHRLMGRIYEVVKMSSGAMMYVPSFIKIGLAIQKLIRKDTLTHSTEIA